MLKKSSVFLLLPVFLLFACRSINQSSIELNLATSLVILSFDDGPNARSNTTARLLDVLKKHEISALFSLLGENAEAYPELVKRIYDEGHYIVNHGYSDKWVCKMGEDEFRNNLIMGEKAISAALGKELNPKLYQPHGGFYRSRHEKIYREAGYIIIPSSVRIYDAVLTGADYDKALKRVMEKTEKQGGGIILLHDGRDSHFRMEKKLAKNPTGIFDRSWIPEMVEELIIELLSKGFTVNNQDILTIMGITN